MNTTLPNADALDAEALGAATMLQSFERVLRDADNENERPLWHAWHYLQVYCHWGLFIPHTAAGLALEWQMKEPGSYAFFDSALEAYEEVHVACNHFLGQVFPQVVDLGQALLRFAVEAGAKDGTFSAVVMLLEKDDTQAVLELLVDLRSQAQANSEQATVVSTRLSEFKNLLIAAQGQLDRVSTKIELDEKTSQATIDRITSSDSSSEESLAGIQEKIRFYREKRQHDITVAATTPTYCWVGLLGLIAAATVAGIYGKAAEDDLRQINAWLGKLQTSSATLATAVATRAIQDSALHSVKQADAVTTRAIDCTRVVQNAWSGMASQIKVVEDKVRHSIRGGDGTEAERLAAKAVVKIYMAAAGQAWRKLEPDLQELMDKPYIQVEKGALSYEQMATEVGRCVHALKAKGEPPSVTVSALEAPAAAETAKV